MAGREHIGPVTAEEANLLLDCELELDDDMLMEVEPARGGAGGVEPRSGSVAPATACVGSGCVDPPEAPEEVKEPEEPDEDPAAAGRSREPGHGRSGSSRTPAHSRC